jgi:hypothetical protein
MDELLFKLNNVRKSLESFTLETNSDIKRLRVVGQYLEDLSRQVGESVDEAESRRDEE